MKIFVASTFLLFCSLSMQAQYLSNVRTIAGNFYEFVYNSVRDSNGNLYVSFYTSGDFGNNNSAPTVIHGVTYYLSPGNHIVKFDAEGEIIWINAYDAAIGMTLDKNDNLFITGSYQQYSFLLAKINPVDGSTIWETLQGANSSATGTSIVVDKDGNSYVTGVTGTFNFFGLSLNNFCCPDHDFIAKFGPTGQLLWIRASPPDVYSAGLKIAFDKSGNIICGGRYQAATSFGPYSLSGPYGLFSSYIVSFSPEGDVRWLKGFYGRLADLLVTNDGSIYFSGAFNATGTFNTTTFISKGGFDLFIGKYSSQANLEWVKSVGTSGPDKLDFLIENQGGIIATGMISDDIIWDGITLNNIIGPTELMVNIASDGEVQSLQSYGSLPYDFSVDITGFNYGYRLHRVVDNCFVTVGMFSKTLNTTKGPISSSELGDVFTGSITPYQTEIAPDAGADIEVFLCETNQTKVPLSPLSTSGSWSFISGSHPTLDASNSSELVVSNISYGKTVLKYTILGCGSADSRLLTLNRAMNPQEPGAVNEEFCSDKLSESLITISGTNITWYQDRGLTTKLINGPVYRPTVSTTLYVTNTANGCESTASPVRININQQPPLPIVENTNSCLNIAQVLNAKGENLKWYDSVLSFSPLSSENSYSTKYADEGSHKIYVTQTINNCESEKAQIEINVKRFSLGDFFVSNVITPNGDGLNESFSISDDYMTFCVGDFQHVSIQNRWGVEVYNSLDSEFAWRAENIASGVYFYFIEFSFQKFNGSISVIR